MSLGPVQLLVVGFERPDFSGEALAELERLRGSEVVRVVDLLVVHRRADGVVQRVHHSDLKADAGGGLGAVVSALIGLDARDYEGAEARAHLGAAGVEAGDVPLLADGEVWSLEEVIPNESAAAIALVEHRWAVGLRDAIRAAGGVPVADAWIHPADLVAAGVLDADSAAPDE